MAADGDGVSMVAEEEEAAGMADEVIIGIGISDEDEDGIIEEDSMMMISGVADEVMISDDAGIAAELIIAGIADEVMISDDAGMAEDIISTDVAIAEDVISADVAIAEDSIADDSIADESIPAVGA